MSIRGAQRRLNDATYLIFRSPGSPLHPATDPDYDLTAGYGPKIAATMVPGKVDVEAAIAAENHNIIRAMGRKYDA